MALETVKAYKWVKKVLILGGVVIMIGAGVVWYLFSKKFANTKEVAADYIINANDFIKEFQKSDSLANAKYSEKIIVVNGIVSEVESADTTTNIKMVDTTSGSYIIFAFQSENQQEAKKLKPGDKVSIKGSCSNGIYSDILETESITFKRCVLNK